MSEYQGKELELFEHAQNWKKYFASFMSPYLKGCVLEVGAGIGGTTKVLCDATQFYLDLLEPDENQVYKFKRTYKFQRSTNLLQSHWEH